MQTITSYFVIALAPTILFVDWLVALIFGYHATITGVIRSWARNSSWPEFIYVVGFLILYYHLFKGWPDER